MTNLLSVAPLLPAYRYSQGEITQPLVDALSGDQQNSAVIRRIHGATGVDYRSLVMHLDAYRQIIKRRLGVKENAHLIDYVPGVAERDSEVRLPPGTFRLVARHQTGYFDANQPGQQVVILVVEYMAADMKQASSGKKGVLAYDVPSRVVVK